MIWFLVFVVIFLLVFLLLLSPLELSIDTRIPLIVMRWGRVGKAMFTWKNEEWMISLDFLFFHRKWSLEKIIYGTKKTSKRSEKKQKTKRKSRDWRRLFQVLRSFQVSKWQLVIDSDDYVQNAYLYPLNFMPYVRNHVRINFLDENYLVATIKNTPWRMISAWIKN